MVAMIGALALFLFAGALDARTAPLSLSAPARAALHAQANRLGDASVPAGVAPEDATATRRAIQLAFVDAFRVLMFICAGVTWLSALMAALFVPAKSKVAAQAVLSSE